MRLAHHDRTLRRPPQPTAMWGIVRASGTKASPPDGATLTILAENNRYAADMPVSALLQAKASSFHLLPAPCASLTTTVLCMNLRSRPRCGASCVPAARHFAITFRVRGACGASTDKAILSRSACRRYATLRQRQWYSEAHGADYKSEPHAQLAVDASPRQSAA